MSRLEAQLYFRRQCVTVVDVMLETVDSRELQGPIATVKPLTMRARLETGVAENLTAVASDLCYLEEADRDGG